MLDEQGKLTPEGKDTAKKWINEKKKHTIVCPICNSTSWILADHLVRTPIGGKEPGVLFAGGPSYPQVMVVCATCAYTMYFNAVMLGLVPSSKKEGVKMSAGGGGSQPGAQLVEESSQLIRIAQMERTVVCFGITEDELEHLTGLNTRATVYYSLASALITLGISWGVTKLMTAQNTVEGELLGTWGAGIAFAVGITFIFLGVGESKTRQSAIDRIKTQSRTHGI